MAQAWAIFLRYWLDTRRWLRICVTLIAIVDDEFVSVLNPAPFTHGSDTFHYPMLRVPIWLHVYTYIGFWIARRKARIENYVYRMCQQFWLSRALEFTSCCTPVQTLFRPGGWLRIPLYLVKLITATVSTNGDILVCLEVPAASGMAGWRGRRLYITCNLHARFTKIC